MPKLSRHVQIDDEANIITIYGINYSGELFSGLGIETGTDKYIQIMSREDGVITLFQTNKPPFESCAFNECPYKTENNLYKK